LIHSIIKIKYIDEELGIDYKNNDIIILNKKKLIKKFLLNIQIVLTNDRNQQFME
jgi:hypothetical protein